MTKAKVCKILDDAGYKQLPKGVWHVYPWAPEKTLYTLEDLQGVFERMKKGTFEVRKVLIQTAGQILDDNWDLFPDSSENLSAKFLDTYWECPHADDVLGLAVLFKETK